MRLRALIPIVLSAVAVVAARRLVDVVQVRGRSMTPTLLPGDRLLVVRAPPRPGDVVLARDPRQPSRELIKRVTSIGAVGVRLGGDNLAASTDARSFGAIPHSAVHWRAVLRYWPIGRFGRIAAARDVEEGGETACAFPEALVVGD
jgi:nickel-type superoxide dismutase maturation protease